jgi:7-dehydrocholesterol reductase
MILVNLLQGLYIIYFFWTESAYIKSIDIHHDHFGWMLAWGDCVWLPYMYTLQALFLVFHPVELSPIHFFLLLTLGLFGFYLFVSANRQKDRFRNEANLSIWGKKAEGIRCHYLTEDGQKRESTLLISGSWGLARHMNYTGDLLLTLAFTLACGTEYIFPYFYLVFLLILLIHRCFRDEQRCAAKYGEKWKEYCSLVPYRFIPYIW